MTGEAQLLGGEQLVTLEQLARPTRIGVIDVGSQLLKPIDRRIRKVGADTIIYDHDVSADELLENCNAFVVSGGGDSVYGDLTINCDPRIFEEDFPLPGLFICLGFQLLNQARGGVVEQGTTARFGQHTIEIEKSPLFDGFGRTTKALINAGDCVTVDGLAPGLRAIAYSRVEGHETVAAFVDRTGKKVAVQFHPEVDLTERGEDIFRHFIHDIAGLELNYTPEAKRAIVIKHIKERVGSTSVASAVSGGVDSSVGAAAVAEAGVPQHVIHVNNGLMRKGESQLVLKAYEARGIPKVHFIDATEEFRHARTIYNGRRTRTLEYEIDPEAKRHIIGDTFARIFEAKIKWLGLDPKIDFLMQGTLRPDLIESAGIGKSAKRIKTHHNDSPLMRQWRDLNNVLEPLRDLHKDEVRELGLELGLPEEVVWRQPFPGPGLGIRVICGKKPDDFDGRARVEDMLRGEFGDYDTSVHLLPIRTVGIQGDARTYRHVAAITSDSSPDWPRYMELARDIPQLYQNINRVIFMSGERINPYRSLFDTVVRTSLTPSIIETLQEADAEVNWAIREHDLLRKIAQEPVILTKLAIDGRKQGRLLVVRPFITNDFMVGSAAVPGSEQLPIPALQAQEEAALSVKGIGRFAIDLTGKPPGTTEWE